MNRHPAPPPTAPFGHPPPATPTGHRGPQRRAHRSLCAAALALLAGAAPAHDTWFEVDAARGSPVLLLGTGERFPVQQSRIEFTQLARHGCAARDERAGPKGEPGRPLSAIGGPMGRLPQALALRLPASAVRTPDAEPTRCWASLVPFDVELQPAQVQAYLDEIAAPVPVREAWAREQAAGRPWRERFVKHARLDLGAPSSVPIGLALEAVVLNGSTPRAREPVALQLLHQGRPLRDHPVELVNERSARGLWQRTDATGRLTVALPLHGRWLLRSTLLRPPQAPGDRWESDFVTLIFGVEAADAAR